MEQLTFLSPARPVNPSQSLDSEEAWLIRVATSPSNILTCLTASAPAGWSGRTSPVSCQTTEDGRLVPASGSWGNAGMGSPTAFLTLSTGAFHKDATVSSLSAILETGDHLRPYCLSATACQGILRRAAKRGKTLPPALHKALTARAKGDTPGGGGKMT